MGISVTPKINGRDHSILFCPIRLIIKTRSRLPDATFIDGIRIRWGLETTSTPLERLAPRERLTWVTVQDYDITKPADLVNDVLKAFGMIETPAHEFTPVDLARGRISGIWDGTLRLGMRIDTQIPVFAWAGETKIRVTYPRQTRRCTASCARAPRGRQRCCPRAA